MREGDRDHVSQPGWHDWMKVGEARLRLNHPRAMLRRWKAAMKPETRNAQQKGHIAELEAARAPEADIPLAAIADQLIERIATGDPVEIEATAERIKAAVAERLAKGGRQRQ